MSKRGAGVALIAIAAILYIARFLCEAILSSGRGWIPNLFAEEMHGGNLVTWAVLALLVRVSYIIWAEYENRKGKN